MPLLDHFHPPLSNHRPWESIHSEWTSSIARQLNGKVLPQHFVALPRVHFGGRMEIDVATGSVRRVTVVKSTGYNRLDEVAKHALVQWRFRPNSWKEVDLPVNFIMASQLQSAR